MAEKKGFNGFSGRTVEFFKELAVNNNKVWFEEHRQDYETYVLKPARSFIEGMGQLLSSVSPGVHADARVNKSLFRINRDTRFSKDKSPYKTHLGIWFWEGDGPRMECSGYYFHLEPHKLMLAAGIHCFPRELLAAYRDAVVDVAQGPALVEAVEQVQKSGLIVGGRHYKKTPRGYDSTHRYADFLLFNGLTAAMESDIPQELYSSECLDYCFSYYKEMTPLHNWLLDLTRGATS